ncbi:MAG TPA: signal peptidase I [Terriglobales bacterium]|nr:signal peptidase I [Terriglobales bacterium]
MAKDKKADVKPTKKKETPMEFIASMASILVVGLFIITFNLQAFEIPSSSMEDTLLIGDHVFVDRVTPAPKTNWFPIIPYRDVHRGDIVVFLSPAEPGLFVVKRVIGVPGDKLHLREGKLFRNGEEVPEPFVKHSRGDYIPYRDDFPSVSPMLGGGVTPEWSLTMREHIQDGELVVPPDSYFAMGDNREVSYDGRYWGFIPRENVVGRPMVIYWSFETPKDQYLKTAWSDRIKFIGKVVLNFFSETRWNRMLHIVR